MTELSTIELAAAPSPEVAVESIADRLARSSAALHQLGIDARAHVVATRAAWDAAVAEAFEVEMADSRLTASFRSASRPRVQGALLPSVPRPLRDGPRG